MAWVELQITGLPSERVDLLSVLLFERGAQGIQEDYLPGEAPPPVQPWDTPREEPPPEKIILRAWFENPDVSQIEQVIRDTEPLPPAAIQWNSVPETDWDEQWKQGFEPIHLDGGVVVSPPWNAPNGALVIDPGQGFGTGKHPSTRACLEAVCELSRHTTALLDVGCGSGIVALLGAKLGLSAQGIDIDPESVRESLRNADLNSLNANFSDTPIEYVERGGDLVVCNLYAEAIVSMHSHLIRLTEKWLVLAGVLIDRENKVRACFDTTLSLDRRIVDNEWVCLWYRR